MSAPFLWHIPTKVIFGSGAVQQAGKCSREFGDRAFLITDKRLAHDTPIVHQLCSILASTGITPVIYDLVEPNPALSAVQAAVEALRECRGRFVVGVGGGSSMDVAKVVAAGIRNPALIDPSLWENPEGWISPQLDHPRRPMPLMQIPTTASTSSEANAVASLMVDKTQRKKLLVYPHMLYAKMAIVDPALTVSVPAQQTARGGVETLLRVLIPYLTDDGSRVVQDRFSEAISKIVLDCTPQAMAVANDLQARESLSSAVTNSTLGWAIVGRNPFAHVLWYLANTLTNVLAVPKADGMAALLPVYLDWLVENSHTLPQLGSTERLSTFGKEVMDVEGNENTKSARKTACALRSIASDWNLPTSLADISSVGDLVGLPARLAAVTHEMWSSGPLDFISEEQLTSFYEAACSTRPIE